MAALSIPIIAMPNKIIPSYNSFRTLCSVPQNDIAPVILKNRAVVAIGMAGRCHGKSCLEHCLVRLPHATTFHFVAEKGASINQHHRLTGRFSGFRQIDIQYVVNYRVACVIEFGRGRLCLLPSDIQVEKRK